MESVDYSQDSEVLEDLLLITRLIILILNLYSFTWQVLVHWILHRNSLIWSNILSVVRIHAALHLVLRLPLIIRHAIVLIIADVGWLSLSYRLSLNRKRNLTLSLLLLILNLSWLLLVSLRISLRTLFHLFRFSYISYLLRRLVGILTLLSRILSLLVWKLTPLLNRELSCLLRVLSLWISLTLLTWVRSLETLTLLIRRIWILSLRELLRWVIILILLLLSKKNK